MKAVDAERYIEAHRYQPSIRDGYILSHGGARTNLEAVCPVGDPQGRVNRRTTTAAGAGCMAIEAERYLEAHGL